MAYYCDPKGVSEAAQILGLDEAALEEARTDSISNFSPQSAGCIRKLAEVNLALAVNFIMHLVRGGVPLREAIEYLNGLKEKQGEDCAF